MSGNTSAVPNIQPTSDRLLVLDVLRGFALFGVLLVNMVDFSSSALMPGYSAPQWDTLNQIIDVGVYLLAVTKFYLLFSFLFGVGFALQMGRMQERGRAFVPFYLRRLAVLLVIGLLHSIFIWRGDILMVYALMGVILLFVRNLSNRVLIGTAVVILIASFVLAGMVISEGDPVIGRQAAEIYQHGDYLDILAHRLTEPGDAAFVIGQVPSVLVMFLLGLIIGRSGILQQPDVYRPFLRRWMFPSLLIGLVFNVAFVIGWREHNSSLAAVGMHIGAPALSFFYASVILLNFERLRALAPVGQMALTNYLTHSIVCTTIFYGYGFGLYDQVTPLGQLALVVLIYGTQIIFSGWWMRRFRFGPMEWVWRSLTYGKAQPIRRSQQTISA